MKQSVCGSLLAAALESQGVRHVFGIPDGTYLPFLASLDDHGIELVTPRHETTAVHMAGAYARITKGLGVCIASNGPGVANALSGVAVENAEGNRVLLITSSRRRSINRPDRGGSYQCFDQTGVIGPMAKWSESVSSPERMPELVEKALGACFAGRAGVVHLDVPEDVIGERVQPSPNWNPTKRFRHAPAPDPAQVEEAAEMLATARLPMLHIGGGVSVSDCEPALMEIVHLLHAPLLTSWSARGIVRETDELVWPMVFVDSCTAVRTQADLVLCIASRLGETDFWGKPPYWGPDDRQEFIRVDIAAERLDLNRPSRLAILSDAGLFLKALLDAIRRKSDEIDRSGRDKAVAPLIDRREKERSDLAKRLSDRSVPMLTAHVPVLCDEVLDEDAILVLDGGNTAVWGHSYHRVRHPGTLLGTPHFGHLGAGAGQALGAAAARPGTPVCCLTGDGAFGFHPQEIETAIRHGLTVVFVVVCDRQWGMVKIGQQISLKPVKTVVRKSLSPEETIGTELGDVAWDQVAAAMGAHGERVDNPDEFREALRRSLDSGLCSVIHVDVDPVKHLWAPGLKNFKKMHQEPSGR